MERKFVTLSVCCAVGALLLAASPHALAGDKGKSNRSGFSQSNGSGNSPSMKLHSNSSRKRMSSGMSGQSMSQTTGQSLGQSFTTKTSKNLAGMSQGNAQAFQLYSGGKGQKGGKSGSFGSSNLTANNLLANPSFNTNGLAQRTIRTNASHSSQLADAIKKGKLKPIDPGIGNGAGPQPGKFKPWEHKTIIDAVQNGKMKPIDPGIGNGDKPGPGFGEKFCDTPNKNKGCHNKYFPWWTIGVGGCYPNNYWNDCHQHHYHNHCYPPIYNHYPPITNVTVVNHRPPELPAQPELVDGIDLELLDLRLVDVGDAAKNLGPRYRITFRNRGLLPAGNFQVMLLASSDGTPQPGLPSGIAEIAGLDSGQLLTADVRLAVTPDLATLGTLIVALDSATQIAEFEEGNNVAVLDRAKIALADLASTANQ